MAIAVKLVCRKISVTFSVIYMPLTCEITHFGCILVEENNISQKDSGM